MQLKHFDTLFHRIISPIHRIMNGITKLGLNFSTIDGSFRKKCDNFPTNRTNETIVSVETFPLWSVRSFSVEITETRSCLVQCQIVNVVSICLIYLCVNFTTTSFYTSQFMRAFIYVCVQLSEYS